MGCGNGGCTKCKCVKAKYKTNCGDCGKMKIKLPKAKAVGLNKNVASQAITTTTTTVLQLTPGAFSFDNLSSYYNNSCCNPCGGYSNTYTNNTNVICLSCEGLYNVTTFATVDTAPLTETVTLALDVNGQQVMAYPLIGSGQSLSFSTSLNLCATDRIQFRVFATGTYVGNVVTGNVSVVKVNDRIGCH